MDIGKPLRMHLVEPVRDPVPVSRQGWPAPEAEELPRPQPGEGEATPDPLTAPDLRRMAGLT